MNCIMAAGLTQLQHVNKCIQYNSIKFVNTELDKQISFLKINSI